MEEWGVNKNGDNHQFRRYSQQYKPITQETYLEKRFLLCLACKDVSYLGCYDTGKRHGSGGKINVSGVRHRHSRSPTMLEVNKENPAMQAIASKGRKTYVQFITVKSLRRIFKRIISEILERLAVMVKNVFQVQK